MQSQIEALQIKLDTMTMQNSKAKLKKVSAGKKKATVQWTKFENAEGYEIVYSLKSNFKSKKTVKINSGTTAKKVIKSLKSKKTYYVKIRAWRTIGGKKVYSGYSAVKKVKVK